MKRTNLKTKLTDVSIDPAGNVWAANNWNFPEAGAMDNPAYATSTWGGGSGFTVIYGVATPVKPPPPSVVWIDACVGLPIGPSKMLGIGLPKS
jgi:hypothetical protein